MRRELIPCLKDARSRGHKAIMKKDKLLDNGKIYSLEELKEKIEPVMRSGSVDNPDGGKKTGGGNYSARHRQQRNESEIL
jgi:hypothetical protein